MKNLDHFEIRIYEHNKGAYLGVEGSPTFRKILQFAGVFFKKKIRNNHPHPKFSESIPIKIQSITLPFEKFMAAFLLKLEKNEKKLLKFCK
jgi:hypothetical protein